MLEIIVPETELFDERTQEFIYIKEQKLKLEHSLVSISKWESKWRKPFLVKGDKTVEETIDYIQCMTLSQNVDPKVYLCLTNENYEEVRKYIDNPMTATILPENKKSVNKEIITSELIYYWMISYNIPVKFEKWHINRLLTLIGVLNIKNQPPKKRNRQDVIAHHKAVNEARRAKFKSTG